jgi:hypothetical protein
MACSVYQYFGERFTGAEWKIFYTEPDNIDYPDFDCSILKQSLDLNFDKFTLTELELLSTTDLNTWLSYCMKSDNNELLGTKIVKNLIADWEKFQDHTGRAFDSIFGNNSFQGVAENFATLDIGNEVLAKINSALKWLQNIHNEFYGKQYLIQIGNSSTGVCIKDRFGNVPQGNIKVESEGGLFYASDAPATGGGWLGKNQNQIMGLNVGPELYPFTESDDRVGCFVKYTKHTEIDKLDLKWEISLSALDNKNYYIKDSDLYVKADVNPAIYKIGSNQYALVTVDAPELLLSPDIFSECPTALASQGATALLALHGVKYKDVIQRTFCGKDKEGEETSGVSYLHSHINIFQMHKPSVCPEEFCLPFKSNIFTYGPWFFQADPVGGTEVEPNKELAPWNFANLQNTGYDVMNYYGSLIAADGPRGLQKQENGSITVASLPSYTIGYIIGGNAGTLTDLQINIGDNGYTTTYNFRTYTPKFGQPGRHLSDLWHKNYKSMSYLNKFFKDQNLEIRALINNNKKELQDLKHKNKAKGVVASNDSIAEGANGGPAAGSPSNKSPQSLILSGYHIRPKETNNNDGVNDFDNSSGLPASPCSCYGQSTPPPATLSPSVATAGNSIKNFPEVVTDDIAHNTWYQQNFERAAINSLDLLFCPMSTNQEGDTDAELPRLAMYQDFTGSFVEFKDKSQTPNKLGDGKAPNSRSRSEIPPFLIDDVLQYDLPIHQMYLNATTSTVMLSDWLSRINGSTQGFITKIIAYGTDVKEFTLIMSDEEEDNKQDATNFRYSVLRGPLSLQSWGYDTSGKPVPNAIDSAYLAERGQFRRRGLQDKFLKDWLSNPKTWPAGPIDLRWDRERGVWVAPPANKIVVARLLTNLEKFGVAEAELVDPSAGGIKFYEEYDIWSVDGANVKQSMNKTKIKVYDFLGVKLCKCDYIYAYYDDNRYIVLESNRAYKDPNESCCPTTTATQQTTRASQPTPTQPTPTSCWCDLDCLKTLKNYDENKHQALVHKKETPGPDCLMWEDIVECYTTPPNFYNH